MRKDPVCGKQIDEKKAPATSFYNGDRYVFCGQECKDAFDENPERFAGQTRTKLQHAGFRA